VNRGISAFQGEIPVLDPNYPDDVKKTFLYWVDTITATGFQVSGSGVKDIPCPPSVKISSTDLVDVFLGNNPPEFMQHKAMLIEAADQNQNLCPFQIDKQKWAEVNKPF
jgi:hypothetical protein